MRAPFVSAAGSLSVRQLVLVSVTDEQGRVGYGEAAPLQPYVNVTIEQCLAALADCRPVLDSAGSAPHDELLAASGAYADLWRSWQGAEGA